MSEEVDTVSDETTPDEAVEAEEEGSSLDEPEVEEAPEPVLQERGEREPFEQTPDARGRVLLDRPLTASEARAQDTRNRERFLAGRGRRFDRRKGPR